MYYLSNVQASTLDEMRQLTVAGLSDSWDTAPINYKLLAPLKLEIYTLHPDDEDHYFFMTILVPDHYLYSELTRKEIAPKFSKLSLHRHDYYELMLVLEGELYQVIEDHRQLYKAGSLCLLNKNVYHTEEHSTDYRVAFLSLREDFLRHLLGSMNLRYFEEEKQRADSPLETFLKNSMSPDRVSEKKYMDFYPRQDEHWLIKNVHGIYEQLAREILEPGLDASFHVESLVLQLFRLLSNSNNYDDVPIQIGTAKEASLFQALSELVIASNGKISRSELEDRLHYSGDYLNKICKKYTGLSLYDYGMRFCMHKAASLLAETRLTVEEIAYSLGFINRTNFYRQFQAVYQMTPAAYRRERKQQMT